MQYPFLVLTILAYSVCFGCYFAYLWTGKKLAGNLATAFLVMGLVFHYLALLERSRGLHMVPYHDLYGSMSLFGWLLGLTYLALEFYHQERSVGVVVLPFVLLFFIVSHFSPVDRLPIPSAQGPLFAFHVTLSILAYAAFALSFVLSLIFLVEDRLLHRHKMGDMVWRLPPLDLLERMSRSSALVGVISIVVGTALGFVVVNRLTGQYWNYDPKYVITILVLLLYVAYLRLARTTAWRGARASGLCVFNFIVVVLSFTVVNLYLSPSHRFF